MLIHEENLKKTLILSLLQAFLFLGTSIDVSLAQC